MYQVKHGAIILCGGRSSRMGSSKALLPFGNEGMLERVVRLVGEVVPKDSIVVVAAQGQALPPLAAEIHVTHDRKNDRGPLEGIASGLTAIASRADACFVTGCDVPLLVPALVERMFQSLGDHDIVVPVDENYQHPLAGVYRSSILQQVEKLLTANQLRTTLLFEQCKTRFVPTDELRSVDPQLWSLRNVNQREDYLALLKEHADSTATQSPDIQ